jgi:hypothetical protein
VIVNTSGGHDTFEYQYDDSNHESGPHAGDANSVGIGTAILTHFDKKTDVLVFTQSIGFGEALTESDVQNAATVIDHVGGHSIKIVIHTSHSAAAGTIVLKGIGTLHHKLTSIADLMNNGYHLEFS